MWISAFNFRGKPRRLIEMADAGEVRLDVSDHIVQEVLRVMRLKFAWPVDRLREAEAQINALGRKVTPAQTVALIKDDPTDNRILECAAAAKSDYLVTGDKHLLKLAEFCGMPIITVAALLDIMTGRQR